MADNNIKAIINANVVLENGIIWDGVILLSDNIITKVARAADLQIPKEAAVIDAKGAYVGPGFVDIHVHGGMGESLFLKPKELAEHFLKHGATSILASPSYSMSFEELIKGIQNIKSTLTETKNIKGINMEGPYMNFKYGACTDLITWNLVIDENMYKPMVDELGDLVKICSIAPEREGIIDFVKYLRSVNPDVVLSVGHSEATPEQIRSLGSKYRPKLTTHLMNATGRNPADSGGVRGLGPDEYCLSDSEMYAELISDSQGVHVHPDMQRMIIKCKGVNRVILITDSTDSNGVSPEKYAYIEDINFDHNGDISGSKLTMDLACRNIMTHTNCGISQAFIMASLNPARVIGMDKEIGSIEPGKIADLVFVDDKFNVKRVMLDGEVCNFN